MAKIAIVEDESIVALDIKHHLTRAGYDVTGIYPEAEQLLEKFGTHNPDLVLMDIQLQGKMDGVKAAAIVKTTYCKPVILLTAFADDETIERAKLTEPYGYILKPFEERELKTTIEMALYRHELELQLIQSEERYRNLFEEALSGNFIADNTGRILDANPAFLQIFGFGSKEQALASNVKTLFPEEEDAQIFWENIGTNEILKLADLVMKDIRGEVVYILANVIAVLDGNHQISEVKGYFIDTTERKKLEQQLLQTQKIEAIGRLAGGVAHDFNNILTVIMGYATIASEKYKDDESIENDLEGIQHAAKKASSLTRQLLAFSRRQVLNPQVLNINNLLMDLQAMFQRLITEDISMYIYPDAEHPNIYVDPGQMEQVLMNLCVNARDAMPDGGNLIIDTENKSLKEIEKSIIDDIPPGQYLQLRVKDNGMGIPKEDLDRIFEPFFTTKPAEQGTGLGLSTVYGIIKQSNGHLVLDSAPGDGTTFTLLFPLMDQNEVTVQSDNEEDHELRGTETILLVEDDNYVRSLLVKVLSRRGFTILQAENAGEAILISEKSKRNIDLIITDVIMPHSTGEELALRLQRKQPNLKVLLMSGYPDKTILDRGILLPERNFIQKPFDTENFLKKIREVLDQ